MKLSSNTTELNIEDEINEGLVEVEIFNDDWDNTTRYYLDEDEIIKLRDHLNKLIEQIK